MMSESYSDKGMLEGVERLARIEDRRADQDAGVGRGGQGGN